jgi:hypothetical protein
LTTETKCFPTCFNIKPFSCVCWLYNAYFTHVDTLSHLTRYGKTLLGPVPPTSFLYIARQRLLFIFMLIKFVTDVQAPQQWRIWCTLYTLHHVLSVTNAAVVQWGWEVWAGGSSN